jgi:hypothetical protein
MSPASPSPTDEALLLVTAGVSLAAASDRNRPSQRTIEVDRTRDQAPVALARTTCTT